MNLLLSEHEVRAALSRVIHPTYGISLISLDMVRGIDISASGVDIALVMNCPGFPAGQLALGRARQALEALVPRGTAQITIRLSPEAWRPPFFLTWED